MLVSTSLTRRTFLGAAAAAPFAFGLSPARAAGDVYVHAGANFKPVTIAVTAFAGDEGATKLASVIAKNAVGSSWQKTLGSREWSRVPEEEKHMVKEATLTLLLSGRGSQLGGSDRGQVQNLHAGHLKGTLVRCGSVQGGCMRGKSTVPSVSATCLDHTTCCCHAMAPCRRERAHRHAAGPAVDQHRTL